MLWRQGDVFIERIWAIPRGAVRRRDLVLAEGELTGHSHRIVDRESATLYEFRQNELLLVVHGCGATVVHEEHGPIELAPGNYRVWRQREFDPAGPWPGRSPKDGGAFGIQPAATGSSRVVFD
jgi:hypothetical protein